MRARLLDMGEVGAVRSQSLLHAAASTLDASSAPIVILIRPAAPIVVVGGSRPVAASVSLEYCRAERIPVVRSPGADEVWYQGPNHLLLYLVAPEACATELGLATDREHWPRGAASPLLGLCERLGIPAAIGERGSLEVDGRSLGRFAALPVAGQAAVCWDLFVDTDVAALESEAEALIRPDGLAAPKLAASIAAGRTTFGAEAGEPLGFAQIAEALVGVVETSLDLELVPSMPTPAEMDAVYEWDERVLVAELVDDPDRGAGRLTSYIM